MEKYYIYNLNGTGGDESTTTTTPVTTIIIMTVAPFLLITLSSILLDIVLQYEKHFDRCKCQVWMWLALTLTALSSSVSNDDHGDHDDNIDNRHTNTLSSSSTSSSDTTSRIFLNSGFLMWGHLTIFGNLVVIFLEGVRVHQQHYFQHRRRQPFFLLTMTSHRQFKQIRSFLKSIPIASWTVMVVDALYWVVNNATMSTNHGSLPSSSSSSSFVFGGQYYSLQIFLITLVTIWLIRWNIHRQQIIQQELQGIPTSDQQRSEAAATTTTSSRYSIASSSSSCNFCDESVWFTWDCHQVIRWIEQQLHLSSSSTESFVSSTTAPSSTGVIRTSTQSDYDNIFHNNIVANHGERNQNDDDFRQEELDMILSILIPQRISGDVLDGLTVDQLMAMKVPFGPACRLASDIAYRLVERYPKPLNMTPTTTMASTRINRSTFCQRQDHFDIRNRHEDVMPSWLAQHDREYNNNNDSNDHIEVRNKVGYLADIDKSSSSAATTTTNSYNDDNDVSFNSDYNQHQQRMENIMRDRFGLELPKVNTIGLNNTGTSGDTQRGIERQQNIDNISPGGQYTAQVEHLRPFNTIQNDFDHKPRQPYRDNPTSSPSTEETVKDDGVNSFPKSILDQMPPHIQEIVQRRPDLVNQLMQRNKLHHRQVQQPQPHFENSTSNKSPTNNKLSESDGLKKRSTTSTAKGMVPNSSRMTTIAESSESNNGDNRSRSRLRHTTVNGDDNFLLNIDSEEDDEDDGDDERTSLIQLPKSKYSSSPPLEYYKSIDGCTGDKDRKR